LDAGRVDFLSRSGGDRKIDREVRVNERIRAREVRLIDEEGKQLGVISTREALEMARERDFDLVEVSPTAQPPVCRIADYGKHKYQQAKREREARKKHKGTEVRLLRMRPQIGDHDLQIKLRKLRELLGEGNKVRISLRFRGREMSRPEMGTKVLNRMAQELADVAQAEAPPRREGRMMNMMLAPKPGVRKAAAAPAKAKPQTPDVKHVEKQVKQEQVAEQRPQNEDPEDSGEAG
jgi:translation initiation factor IF-3